MIKNTTVIQDLATLHVITDELRLSIFQQIKKTNLAGKLASAKQLSEQLNLPQTKIYYHLKMLEQYKFIEVGETRLVSGIQEKLYRTSAPNIVVADHLLGGDLGRQSILQFAPGMFNASLAEIENSIQSASEPDPNAILALFRQITRLNARQAQEFNQRLEKLFEDFSELQLEDEAEKAQTYALLLTMYPLAEDPPDQREDKKEK